MNALTWPSIALIVVLVFISIYWLSRLLRRDGASQQKDKDRENKSEYMEENAPAWYDGRVGTGALGVRDNDAWGKGAPASTGTRVEPGDGDVPEREKEGDKVHDA